jgi:RNA recognition motif-containing protein
VENLPKKVKSDELNMIFAGYDGFREVRQIPEKCIAFVEFETDDHASYALTDIKQSAAIEVTDPETGDIILPRITFGKNRR